MSKKQRGMGMAGAMWLLFIGGIAGMTLKNAVGDVIEDLKDYRPYPSSECLDQGPGAGFNGLSFQSGSELDEGCAAREAGRMAPDEARKEFMWCSLPESIRAFGSVRNCLDYNGNNDAIIAQVQMRMEYCKAKSKKILRRLTFQRNRYYDRCMNEWRGG